MALQLFSQIQYLKGVGPKLGEVLRDKGISTVQDLLEYYPRTYEDRRVARDIRSLKANETVVLRAEVVGVSSFRLGRSAKRAYDITLRDASGIIHCKFFRTPFRGYFERFEAGKRVRVLGKVILYRGQLEFHHPELQEDELSDSQQSPAAPLKDELLPIYSESELLNQKAVRKMIERALLDTDMSSTDRLPASLVKKFQLLSKKQALEQIHRPSPEQSSQLMEFRAPGQFRLIFEEFFWFELTLAILRRNLRKNASTPMPVNRKLIDPFLKSLPFELTKGQLSVFSEISQDLSLPHPMNRLVQGDVGSGKTIVAFLAALQTIANGHQAALMVPTEILAEQHFAQAKLRLEPLGVSVGFLSGSLKAKEKAELHERLNAGEIDLLVGTHAIIEPTVIFKSLGLVIIDEQHRFGVEQRAKLQRKGVFPHVLILTATPIPRTLSMTVYGDLDVSSIRELPKGRVPIVTKVTKPEKRAQVMEFLKKQLDQGHQAYVIYPLVEESEKVDLKNAVDEHAKLAEEFADYSVALLHGKMSAAEKDQVMARFRRNEVQILVSTTVIEVGVDVANATVMIIEHAERFGLSQLHQLRGRVGRGAHKSYCVLISGWAVSEDGRKRLAVLEETGDGFIVAEKDLEIRGPGDIAGTRQAGLPQFKLANLFRDVKILEQARQAARDIIDRDPDLKFQDHRPLKDELFHAKGRLGLAHIG